MKKIVSVAVAVAVSCLACTFRAMGRKMIEKGWNYQDIYYNVYDDYTAEVISHTAEVITGKPRDGYNIPSTLEVHGKKIYSVTAIADNVFTKSITESVTFPEDLIGIPFQGDLIRIPFLEDRAFSYIGDRAFSHSNIMNPLTIPQNVKSIGSYAFEWCIFLRSVTFKGGKSSIGEGAFASCFGLNFLAIEKGEISIGAKAFQFCTELEFAQIGSNVESDRISIGAGAFNGCTRLSTLRLHGVTGIGTSAFKGCKKLDDIFIPGIMKDWGEAIFEGCESLKSITINEGVTSIGYGAFRNTPNIEKIPLPNSLTSIEAYAFADCPSLAYIEIPKNVTSIEANAFANCSALTSVVIHGNVKDWGKDVFKGCESLRYVTIGDEVTSIGDGAFRDLPALTEINFPDSGLTSIGANAFAGCDSLREVTVPGSIKEWGKGVFQGCTSLESVTFEEGLTSLGAELFRGCSSLASIRIPGSIKSIEDRIFTGCTKLQDIYLDWANPFVGTVKSHSFDGVAASGKVLIPKGAKYEWFGNGNSSYVTIGGLPVVYGYYTVSAVAGDPATGSVTGSGESEEIDYGTVVTQTAKPSDGYHFVKWTDARGFSLSTDNPYTFTVKSDVWAHFAVNTYRVSVFDDGNGTTALEGDMYAQNTEVTVAASAYAGYHFAKWINAAGDSLSADNPYTFVVKSDAVIRAYFAENKYRVDLSAVNGTIKSGSGVYAHNMEATAEAVATEKGARFVKWTDAGGKTLSVDNPFTFTVREDMALRAHFAAYAFSEVIDGLSYDLDVVGHTAAVSSTNRERDVTAVLVIPSEVRSGNGQRYAVTAIRAEAFRENKKLLSVTIQGGITEIDEYAFADCPALNAASLPNSVTGIGKYAFANCLSLASASLPNSVTSLGEKAFVNCRSLTSVTVPGGTGGWGNGVFRLCESLRSVTFGEGLGSVGAEAFQGCSSLVSVTIPSSMTRIEKGAFSTCSNLQDIELEWDSPNRGTVEADAFSGVPSSCRVHIPKGSEERYGYDRDLKAVWQGLPIVSDRYAVSAETSDSTAGHVTGGRNKLILYTMITLTADAAEGYHFEKWTDRREGSSSLPAVNPFTFVVAEDMNVQAVFAKNSYTLSVSAGANGSAAGGKVGFYRDYMKATATAGEGYHFVKWTDAKGDSVSANNPYEFPLTGDTELRAVFGEGYRSRVTVTVSETNGGHAYGGGEYDNGGMVRLEASADPGYYFTGWTHDGVRVSTETVYVFRLTEGGSYSYTAGFARYMTGNGLPAVDLEARAYYADGALHLVNLTGSAVLVSTIGGRQVLQFKAGDGEYPADLPAGVYVLSAASGKGKYVTKFAVKE
ncbi:hypothetical protein Barb4_03112 [Bacteroidales bacterium Barb4]|nr:hypothetical protein Barb4_03112 [Bacteroidales bacterium Barb4]